MAFNPNAVDQIDQNTVESDGQQFPTIQWAYGDMKMKKSGGMAYQGGFFISEANAPADLTAYGWQKDSFITSKGEEIEGFYARELELSVINSRKRWEVQADDGRRYNYGWNDYDKACAQGGPSSRAHFLVLIKGMEDLGPVVLTLKGSAGMYFEGTRTVTGVLAKFSRTVIAAANKLTKKGRWPYRAFWLKVGADRTTDGTPNYTKVGSGDKSSSVVVPVALGLPDKPEQVNLDTVYVGNEILAQVNELYTDNIEWASAWDVIVPGSSDTDTAANSEQETTETEITPEAAAAVGL